MENSKEYYIATSQKPPPPLYISLPQLTTQSLHALVESRVLQHAFIDY